MMRYVILMMIMVMTLSTGAGATEDTHKGKPNKLAPNKLIGSSSPYLLQHAYNPVEWYPWSEEAFAKARKENKPILLSIGYAHMVQALLRLPYISSPRLRGEAGRGVSKEEHPHPQEGEGVMETKAHVTVSTSESKREGDRLTITAVLDIAEGWHINANSASLDFLIPTSVDVREDSGEAEVKPAYPQAKTMTTPLGDIKVYEGKVSIPVTVTLPGQPENLRLLVRAQACKGTTCLAPSDWVISLSGRLLPLNHHNNLSGVLAASGGGDAVFDGVFLAQRAALLEVLKKAEEEAIG